MTGIYPQWIMFGDSITQQSFSPGGLGQYLADLYQRRIDIVNRGYGGYNSTWGMRVAPHIFPKTASSAPLKVLSIWWGANDSCLPMRTQSVPIEEYKANLNALIDMLRDPSSEFYAPDTVIIILSPPPVCIPQRAADVRQRWGPDVELDRSAERTRQFAVAAQEVASDRNVGFVPVYDEMMQAAGPDPDEGLPRLLSDGLHLTPEGYQVVASAVSNVITDKYPQLLPDNLPRMFPAWDVIDPKNLDKSFSPSTTDSA